MAKKTSPIDKLAKLINNITYEDMMVIAAAMEERLGQPRVRSAADFAATLYEIVVDR